MRYWMQFNTGFLIEADNHADALKKGWDFIHENLPKDVDTECSELSYINLDGEEEDE